ncbi:uncharacterized protein EHS24_009347 [Apiotrichum porosum]|uniref:Uncharacterized protein n=1 Tax=Apiotrichum porosum TaxID=105984 RepID=A0A427XLE4_9TREE|nr:uncharacterized protein EHS24_009347 [Apiotrichum porosum]RSH79695.1 hypothetical protein EHS24_009347 [Apiotrichum porosum]
MNPSTALPRPRGVLALATVLGVVVLVSLILDSQLVFSERPLVATTYEAAVAVVKSSVGQSSSCPAHCPSDPFVQPGMLHWSKNGNDNETRWMPFPTAKYQWEVMPDALHLPLNDTIPPEVWQNAPEQYTARLERHDDAWDWMRNRTVIFVGELEVEQLCEIIGGRKEPWGGHTGGLCYVERLDLLVMNWFMYGMVDSEGGWPEGEAKPATFENRINEVMLPKMREAGFGGRKVSLSVVSSLFWDDAFLSIERGRLNKDVGEAHGYLWNEIAWHRGRVRELIQFMRGLFGSDLPLMFRTRQLRLQHDHFKVLRIFQLDQGCRAIAKEMAVRLFTWGGKLEGYDKFYDDDQHYGKGPNTYVFGDMMFFYLHRAITPGCWKCHQWDD